MNRSMPGLPVHHQLPEFTQTHVHWVWGCHPTISSSVIPFYSCPQSFPALGSFQMSQLFASGGQSIGVPASTSVLPMNTQDWSPSGWTGWISLQSKGLSRVFSNTTVQKHQFFGAQVSSQSNSSHPYMTTGKTTALTTRAFVEKVMSLLFNMAIFLNRAHIIKKDTWGILTLHGGWQSAFCTAMYKGIQCDSKNSACLQAPSPQFRKR